MPLHYVPCYITGLKRNDQVLKTLCTLHEYGVNLQHLFIYHGMVTTSMVRAYVIHSFDIMSACINHPIYQSIKQARRQMSLLIKNVQSHVFDEDIS